MFPPVSVAIPNYTDLLIGNSRAALAMTCVVGCGIADRPFSPSNLLVVTSPFRYGEELSDSPSPNLFRDGRAALHKDLLVGDSHAALAMTCVCVCHAREKSDHKPRKAAICAAFQYRIKIILYFLITCFIISLPNTNTISVINITKPTS